MLKALFVAAAVLGMAAPAAQAQTDFPNKPVTLIVPFAAGGPSDVNMRFLADALNKVWNQPVIVENKPGGGTLIGTQAMLAEPADGYTIGQISGAFTIIPSLRELPYDTLKDVQGLTLFARNPMVFAAHTGFAPNNLKELVEESKKRQLSYASSGLGSASHMAAALLQSVTGANLQHVPYGGNAESTADVISGRVDFVAGNWTYLASFIKDGKLKLIAVSDTKRLPDYPDVETITESFPALEGKPVGSWIGLMIKAGTPPEIVQKLSDGIKKATEDETFRKQLIANGNEPVFLTPEETQDLLASEVANWAEVVKSQGIKLQ